MAESTAVTKPFDAREFEDTIKARIKQEFLNLLPDEMFTNMVRETLERFQHSTTYKQYAGAREETRPSEFDRIVLEEYREWVKAQMKLVLESEEWRGTWGDGRQHATEAITKLLTENAGVVVANVLGSAMQSTLANMQNQL